MFFFSYKKDLNTISMQTGIDINALKPIFDTHFQQNTDGRMNRKCYRDMYYALTFKDMDYIDNLSKNVFKALGVQDLHTEQISFNEFWEFCSFIIHLKHIMLMKSQKTVSKNLR